MPMYQDNYCSVKFDRDDKLILLCDLNYIYVRPEEDSHKADGHWISNVFEDWIYNSNLLW